MFSRLYCFQFRRLQKHCAYHDRLCFYGFLLWGWGRAVFKLIPQFFPIKTGVVGGIVVYGWIRRLFLSHDSGSHERRYWTRWRWVWNPRRYPVCLPCPFVLRRVSDNRYVSWLIVRVIHHFVTRLAAISSKFMKTENIKEDYKSVNLAFCVNLHLYVINFRILWWHFCWSPLFMSWDGQCLDYFPMVSNLQTTLKVIEENPSLNRRIRPDGKTSVRVAKPRRKKCLKINPCINACGLIGRAQLKLFELPTATQQVMKQAQTVSVWLWILPIVSLCVIFSLRNTTSWAIPSRRSIQLILQWLCLQELFPFLCQTAWLHEYCASAFVYKHHCLCSWFFTLLILRVMMYWSNCIRIAHSNPVLSPFFTIVAGTNVLGAQLVIRCRTTRDCKRYSGILAYSSGQSFHYPRLISSL